MFDNVRMQTYLASAVLSAFAGLAFQLRNRPTPMKCLTAFMNAGLCGLSITLIGLSTVAAAYPEAVIGLSVLTGLGGMKAVDGAVAKGQEAIDSLIRASAKKAIDAERARRQKEEQEEDGESSDS